MMLPLGLFLLLLAIGMTTDVRARRVPNRLVLVMLGLACLSAIGAWSLAGSLGGFAMGLAVGLAIWLPFWFLGLLGAGDVKFFAAGAAWVGAPLAWRAALITAVLGGLMGVVILLRQRGARQTLAGVVLQYQQASQIIASADVAAADATTRTFPYAVPMALALGGAAIVPQHVLGWWP